MHEEPSAWRYSVASLELSAGEPSDGAVNATMKKWAEHGWELVSGTAVVFTVSDRATPFVRYVMYWRKRVDASSRDDPVELPRTSAIETPDHQGGTGPRTVFDVVIAGSGENKIRVIKAVRALTGWGLAEAKALVDAAPRPLRHGVRKEEADRIAAELVAAGAIVELNEYPGPWS